MIKKNLFTEITRKILMVALPTLFEKAGHGVKEWALKDSRKI